MKMWMQWFAVAVLSILLVSFLVFVTIPRSDNDTALRVLRTNGYTNIELTGARWLGCGKEDFFRTGFEATTVTGERISGVVCSGVFKNATIRFD